MACLSFTRVVHGAVTQEKNEFPLDLLILLVTLVALVAVVMNIIGSISHSVDLKVGQLVTDN